jgi:hypothetical protein
MGYGHLRPAQALADACGGEVWEADQPPLASDWERRVWDRTRSLYERLCRTVGIPVAGVALRGLLERITDIRRPGPRGSQSKSSRASRYVGRLAKEGLCRGLVERLLADGSPLVTTFYAPAVVADAAGIDSVCVVTDVDVNRVWVARDPARSRVRYCVPAHRTARRLLAYGVEPDRIHVTGFPLPPGLLGGPGLPERRRLLANRLRRLDPAGAFARGADAEARRVLSDADPAAGTASPHVVFAIGGAGAQREIAEGLVGALAGEVERGALRLTVVAGTRPDTKAALDRFLERSGHRRRVGRGLEVLSAQGFPEYAARFERAVADADLLWTKPSELVFFGALGLPIVLAPPLGCQERENGRWARRRGAGVVPPRLDRTVEWMKEWFRDGSFARAAWAGASRMPAEGTFRVLDVLERHLSAKIVRGYPRTADRVLRSSETAPLPSEPVPE